jgi:hypothetical protein
VTGKQSGLGDNFYIGGYDLSGDVSSVDQISGPMSPIDVTGIKQSANQRTGGERTGDLQFTTFFNYTTSGTGDNEHTALSALPTTDTIATYFRGTALGTPSACILGRQINYDGTRDNTGNLTLKVEVQGDKYGLEWGIQATAGLRTDTTGTTGTALDLGAGSTFGAQAYLQLVAFTGTSIDVTVQHCTTSGGTYATLIDFGSQTGIGAWRGSAAGTVDEFIKIVTTGTFTSATFAVMLNVNPVAVLF